MVKENPTDEEWAIIDKMFPSDKYPCDWDGMYPSVIKKLHRWQRRILARTSYLMAQ